MPPLRNRSGNPASLQPKQQGPTEQHWPSSGQQRQGVLPLPRYATAMPAGTTAQPPLVPIYSTLSEAIHHQQQQKKKQHILEQQAMLQVGGARHVNAHGVELVRESVSNNPSRQVSQN